MTVWDYIVLGQIPGTSVQVTFMAWLFGMASLLMLCLIYKYLQAALAGAAAPADAAPAVSSAAAAQAIKARPVRHAALATKLIVAIRMRHAIQTAAYSRWLLSRQQIQA